MDLRTALRQGTQLLEEARVPVPRLTAEVLLCHAIQRPKEYLFTYPEAQLSEVGWIHYGRYLHERMQGKPTQYITKQQEFYGRPFHVSPAVLIPRPETEHVVEAVLRFAPDARQVIDVGCGSGAIAITLALELAQAEAFATDISHEALLVAQRNAADLKAQVRFAQCDLLAGIRSQSMDVVASNPPYVPKTDEPNLQPEVRDYEPHVALYGGQTGHEMYERLIPEAARVLRPGGWLVMELGYRSLAAVGAMLGDCWQNAETVADLAGYPRVLAAQYRP